MAKRFLITLLSIFILIQSAYSVDNLLSCDFREGMCLADEEAMFYGHNAFYQHVPTIDTLNVLSSNVALSYSNLYNKSLCCKITNDDLNAEFTVQREVGNSDICNNDGQLLMYFTGNTNSRIGFKQSDIFDVNDYSDKLCVKMPEAISNFQILVNDDNRYASLGYSCLYRTNDLINGHVSSCDATFDNGTDITSYKYIVWGKLWENLDSLQCNSDCTSKLDKRVYSSCSQKITSCSDVPLSCDGSIYGAWVQFDENGNGVLEATETNEIQCSAPWNNIRSQLFTNSDLKLETVENTCENLVTREYSVMYQNELITMNIYICNDQ